MKKSYLANACILASLISATTMLLTSCNGDDSDPLPQLTGNSKIYPLATKDVVGVSGTVTFAERSDNATVITIQLSGTQAGGDHPAHIHNDNAAAGGGIVLDLINVDGATGKSETVVFQLNDGSAVSYSQLLDFDGYVNVHQSATSLATIIAQGDIGQNELTGESELYALGPMSDPSISGTLLLEERKNGETLATISLTGTTAGGDHPAHIHNNSAVQGGGIAVDFNNVNGGTGKSVTNITQLNSGTAITYSQLLDFNGYANVHLSSANLATLIAQGDIGQNALTGDSREYELGPVSDPAISGTVTFQKRKNGTALVTILLEGTTAGGDHPSHIHNNSASQGGGIAIDLTNVNGDTGKSVSNVTQLNSGTAITYDQLLEFNGYVNVHLSAANLATLIAQGDIGSNAP